MNEIFHMLRKQPPRIRGKIAPKYEISNNSVEHTPHKWSDDGLEISQRLRGFHKV